MVAMKKNKKNDKLKYEMKQNLGEIFLFSSFQNVYEAKKREKNSGDGIAKKKKMKNLRKARTEIVFALLGLMLALTFR